MGYRKGAMAGHQTRIAEAVENMVRDRHGRSGHGAGLRPVRLRSWRRTAQIIHLAGARLIDLLTYVARRDALCAAVAAIFTFVVVIPTILICADRSLPFEYVDTSIVEKAAVPGERVHFRLTVRRVNKECRGHVDRVFIDSKGQVFPLRPEPTAYQYFDSKNGLRIVQRQFVIPDEAAPGEGTYASFPEFWCYPLQFLWPIKAPALRAKVAVVPKGTRIDNPRELLVVPPSAVR